jgi:hypothetical protein
VKEIARNSGTVTEVDVNAMIDFLRRVDQKSLPYQGDKKDNLKYVAAVRRWIAEGDTATQRGA